MAVNKSHHANHMFSKPEVVRLLNWFHFMILQHLGFLLEILDENVELLETKQDKEQDHKLRDISPDTNEIDNVP